jgi:hypothetical protein
VARVAVVAAHRRPTTHAPALCRIAPAAEGVRLSRDSALLSAGGLLRFKSSDTLRSITKVLAGRCIDLKVFFQVYDLLTAP